MDETEMEIRAVTNNEILFSVVNICCYRKMFLYLKGIELAFHLPIPIRKQKLSPIPSPLLRCSH